MIKQEKRTLTGTYRLQITGYDWGCGTSKVILTFDYPLDQVTKDTFSVTETKQITDSQFVIKEATLKRIVTDVYLCDEKGCKVKGSSYHVALELYVSPTEGSPLLFDMETMLNTWSKPYYLTISFHNVTSLTSEGIPVIGFNIDTQATDIITSADCFKTDTFESTDGIIYHYAYFEPVKKTDTLIVWLHGLGEGGTINTDPYITLLANKVTALASDDFQKTIGNAHILVPQCPTYWMDNDGKKSNFNNGSIIADGTSYYTESLDELICYYQKKYEIHQVVLAGCSNGGYMSLVMAIAHPNSYKAIVPICEALPDAVITDEQILAIKDLPMYFIYSCDDTTIDPKLHEIPTIERLKNVNATDIHVSSSEHVIDLSGKYKTKDGAPYQYMGHWSWIYFYNNDCHCDKCDITIWKWIEQKVKSSV